MSEKVLNGARAAEFWEAAKRALSTKQDTLTGRPGQVVGFDASGAAAVVEGWSGWNFADNGGFDIWQKGTEFDAGSRIYTADRWHNDNQVCRYERIDNPFTNCPCQYAMKVTAMNDAQWLSVAQPIDPELAAALDGQTVTISTWVMGRSAAPGIMWLGSIRKDGIPMDGQPHHVSATGVFHADAAAMVAIAIDASSGTSTGDWQIMTGVKIELGDVATPFSPQNKALELAKCQRYMLVLPNYGTLFAGVGIGAAYGTDKVKYIVPIPVSMRIVPSVTISGLWTAQGNGKSIAIPSSARFVAYEMSANAIGLCMENCPSSFVRNQLYKLETDNDPTAKIIFDANL